MRVLITGANGQLGTELMRAFSEHELIGLTRADVDFSSSCRPFLRQLLADFRPDVVINTVALHAAPCEQDLARATLVNAWAPRILAEESERVGSRLIQISSDYVFGADRQKGFYVESDPVAPLNAYGQTKALSESYVLGLNPRSIVVRTSVLFGPTPSRAKGNIVQILLDRARRGEPIRAVTDQISCPTSTPFLAETIKALVDQDVAGIFHVTNDGFCSFYELAQEIVRQARLDVPVLPCLQKDLPSSVIRPFMTVLDTEQPFLLQATIPTWQDALGCYLDYARQTA